MSARSMLKQVVESVLRLNPRSPRAMRGRSLILAYHNVVPDELAGRGDQSLHLSLGAFTSQLELLQRHCSIRPLSEVLSGARSDEGPVIAITFDDAYRGAVDLALPELRRRNLPATVFVAPGLLGHASFWWDDFAEKPGGLTAEIRNRVLEREAGRPATQSSHAAVEPAHAPLPACYGAADLDGLVAQSRSGLLSLGAHTWSHPNLTRITPAELVEELSRPLEWLRTSALPTIPVLAYPYGISSPAVEAAAAAAGYDAALLIDGGWFGGLTERWRVPRFNVPAGLSRNGLLLRLTGILRLGTAG